MGKESWAGGGAGARPAASTREPAAAAQGWLGEVDFLRVKEMLTGKFGTRSSAWVTNQIF
jgi:hypothetical protein